MPEESFPMPTNRIVSGRFKAGTSGNPSGRPKDEVGPLARKHTKEAVDRLVFWMRSNNPKASVAATVALLDRGYGKPAQAHEIGEGFDKILEMLRAKYA